MVPLELSRIVWLLGNNKQLICRELKLNPKHSSLKVDHTTRVE